MPTLTLNLDTRFKFGMSFDGAVEPLGGSEYRFSGTLTVNDPRQHGYTDSRIARFEHGGSSRGWTRLEYISTIKPKPKINWVGDQIYLYDDNDRNGKIISEQEFLTLLDESDPKHVFEVAGQGSRAEYEPVEFRLSYKDGWDTEFTGDKTTPILPGPPQTISPTYTYVDGSNRTLDVSIWNGTACSHGPTGFILEGELKAVGPGGSWTRYATFGYKTSSGSWQYKTITVNGPLSGFTISGTRKPGEHIQLIVGATTQFANTYAYGSVVDYALP